MTKEKPSPLKPSRLWKAGILLAFVVFLFLFPRMSSSNYIVSIGVTFCTFACLGVSWNIIGGYAAQISWCHSSFVAIGAYTGFLLFNHFGISPWISVFAGTGISAVAALIIGSISFRLRGPFFSLCTIAFAEIMRVWLLFQKNLTQGANGLVITFKQESFVNLMFRKDDAFYYILLVMLILYMLISWLLQRSRPGYYLRAIKVDEDAAESLGIKTHRIKLFAFVLSAVMTSAVGTIYAFFLTYIDPASISSMDLATRIGTMAVVGGAGTLFGPMVGALALVPLSELANVLLGSSGSGMLLYGGLMIIVIIFRRGGIVSLFSGDGAPVPALLKKLRGKGQAKNGGDSGA
ncbi:MAG: branched-chain amino acid ABC transporter permease [Oscillospiraceae bacterium]|jgi:branched-chain amino acid transport system permease protein|nr:branched-chain amino acid ABC transporter permease [Oscillospiraceae bacterium]